MKYVLVLLSMGAYAYVSNQDFKDQSRVQEYAQVQSSEGLSR
jgi:hypothetical protein